MMYLIKLNNWVQKTLKQAVAGGKKSEKEMV